MKSDSGKSAFFNPLCQRDHSRFLFRTGRPLVHMQVEVIRRLRQIECRILRHDTIYTDITAHFYQRQYGIDYYIESYSINHGIVRTIAAAINSGVLISAGVYPLSAPIRRATSSLAGSISTMSTLSQAEQLAQLDEAQSYRTGPTTITFFPGVRLKSLKAPSTSRQVQEITASSGCT